MRRLLLASVSLVLLTAVIALAQAQQPDQAGYTISVVGQVNMPGMFHVRADRTLYLVDTIALARGLTARADKKNVEISAITKLAAAKLAHRDQGERTVRIQKRVHIRETGFREIVLLRE